MALAGAALYFGSKQMGNQADSGQVPEVDPFTRYDQWFKTYGALNGVPWKWLKAIAMNESSLGTNPRVVRGDVSEDGKSWGLMQFTLPTAQQFDPSATPEKLNDPEYSIKLGAKFLAWIMARFSKVELRFQEWVIKSYNQGFGNTTKERSGVITGYAGEYWSRFQRNFALIEQKQGGE